jgi:uncharacterized protein YjdB
MSQYQIAVWLLLIAGSRTGECRVVTGPDGLCAFGHLEPTRGELRVGSTLHVRVNGAMCSSRDCVDCDGTRHRVRWRSTAPDVATVDSMGLVRAEHVGRAEIRLESADGTMPSATMQVEVHP